MRVGFVQARPSPPYYVGIDVGTSSLKVVLVDADGRVAGQQSESYPLLIERQGWVEQDPRQWWEALRHSFDRFWADGFSASDVEGIGITGQMHGLVMLDRSGSVIRPAILWNDQRTVAESPHPSSPARQVEAGCLI